MSITPEFTRGMVMGLDFTILCIISAICGMASYHIVEHGKDYIVLLEVAMVIGFRYITLLEVWYAK